jgi:hypothetical protein
MFFFEYSIRFTAGGQEQSGSELGCEYFLSTDFLPRSPHTPFPFHSYRKIQQHLPFIFCFNLYLYPLIDCLCLTPIKFTASKLTKTPTGKASKTRQASGQPSPNTLPGEKNGIPPWNGTSPNPM